MNSKTNLMKVIPVCIIFFMVALKIFLIFNSHLGLNEAVYSYIAEQLPEKLPYKDIFDHKPPLVYYSLALFYSVFGSSVIALHSLAFIFDILLLVIIFIVAKKLYDTKAALFSSAIYFVLSSSVFFDTEVPMTLFGLIGVFLYLSYFNKNKYSYLFFSGVFLAVSVWFKQPGILFFVSILIHQFYLVYKKDLTSKDSLKLVYFVVAGALVFSLPLLSYFIFQVGFENFFFHIIEFNIKFSGSTSRIFQIGKLLKMLVANFGILLAIILTFYKDYFKEKYPYKNRFFFMIILLLILFFIINKEVFFSHLIQLAPFVIILSVSALKIIKNRKINRLITILLIFILLNFSLVHLESVARKVRDNSYNQQDIVVSYINQNLSNASIFADSPVYYVLADKQCDYKVCFLAPSTSSVFSFEDFCNFSKTKDYLVLTHRKKYLGEENLNCIEENFILTKKFDNIDESFVEIWKIKMKTGN